MKAAVLKEMESLRRLTVSGLREKYREVFGEESRSNHKDFLFRRIAWRLQANAEGGRVLSAINRPKRSILHRRHPGGRRYSIPVRFRL